MSLEPLDHRMDMPMFQSMVQLCFLRLHQGAHSAYSPLAVHRQCLGAQELDRLVALQLVRTLSTPEPLPAPEAAPKSQTTNPLMHSVASLGVWNFEDVTRMETPVTPPAVPALPKGLPRDTDLAVQDSGTPRGQVAGAPERLPCSAAPLPQQSLGPATPSPEKVPAASLELASLNAEDAAELLANPPALPTIAEEETPTALPAAEGEACATGASLG